ncbi:hypothetical protein GCM10023237_13290 [Streptomyces coeruleoprunus]
MVPVVRVAVVRAVVPVAPVMREPPSAAYGRGAGRVCDRPSIRTGLAAGRLRAAGVADGCAWA